MTTQTETTARPRWGVLAAIIGVIVAAIITVQMIRSDEQSDYCRELNSARTELGLDEKAC